MARTAAATQAFLIVLSSAVLVVAWCHAASTPFDRQTLAIDVGELRSHAAEAALMIDGIHALPSTLVREHAQQLADQVATMDEDLGKRGAESTVADEHRATIAAGTKLHADLDRVVQAADASQDRQAFMTIAKLLAAQQHRLDPSE